VKRLFYSAFVWKYTDICKHRFGVQLLQNPPLCSCTASIPSLGYLYLEADGPALMVPGKSEEEKSWNLSKWVPGTKSEESYTVEFDSLFSQICHLREKFYENYISFLY
jgi:hypothetical protein